jgi:hypothetical protein
MKALHLGHVRIKHTPARLRAASWWVFDLVGEVSDRSDYLEGANVARLELCGGTSFNLLPPDEH